MRLVKAALFAFLIAGLATIWVRREPVVAAYRDDSSPEALRLDGIDLAYRLDEAEPSPFLIPTAPDTRSRNPQTPWLIDAGPATVPVVGGAASLTGLVVGPGGRLANAKVQIERQDADGIGRVDLVTQADGTWELPGVVGGRYRVRAWVPNQLTMPSSEVRFVAEGDEAAFTFELGPADPVPLLEFLHGGLMYESNPAQVAVSISRRIVDGDGILVAQPVAEAPVTVETEGAVQAVTTAGVTGADGVAWFTLLCPPGSGTAVSTLLGVNAGEGAAGAESATVPGDAEPGDAVPSGISLDAVPSGGTLVARSGDLVASFAIPGCLSDQTGSEVQSGDDGQ